ncbi:hydrolase 1, exosortase A system-associated [Sphingopyxis sp. QXT-31]|uniref:hydrolase 1, exosortase A system-associated n=1 Tax=Sphingopyxis sp. QXT-31 TaxID=1357916 RepID=UPI00097963DA|nr:hydrolase 1, exosortase A system-associated [Sphingopyxis sp. QXT-31]APZ97101.1 hydrolase 1, exosortase A system-associated [Sphingopyxis sp. QXT-31]
MRRPLNFACENAVLAATLDEAAGSTGLLIVSGGNEIRSGAHRGMAMLAQRSAAAGHPVFRFDRRGIGDSDGDNGGYRSSGPDIAAALAAFREAAPQLTRVVAFGNCDAASALLLHQPLAVDGLILANPWTYEDDCGDEGEAEEPALPPASAIRSRYLTRLKDPKSLLRLVKGEIDLKKLARGLSAMRKKPAAPAFGSLAGELDATLAEMFCPVTILLATGDRTAQAFMEKLAPSLAHIEANAGSIRIERLASPSHSFAGKDGEWLAERILAALG